MDRHTRVEIVKQSRCSPSTEGVEVETGWGVGPMGWEWGGAPGGQGQGGAEEQNVITKENIKSKNYHYLCCVE